jgi:NitT/TauT family transport system substrate-binding protein
MDRSRGACPGGRGIRARTAALTAWAAGLILGLAGAPAPTPAASPPKPAAPPRSAPAAGEVATVKVGVLATLTSGPLFIAMERGYFQEQGIKVVPEILDTGPRMIPALATGQLDASSGAISAGLFNAVARGIKIKLVAQQATSTPGHGNVAMFVRKDLLDRGVFKDYRDMKGKKVGITSKASQSEVLLDKALAKGGLKVSDVGVVELTVADMAAAFTTRALDIGFINEPTATATEDKGFAVRWKTGDLIYPNQQFTVWMYSERFAAERPEVGIRLMAAILRGTRDFVEAFDKRQDKASVVDILIRHTPITDRPLYERMITAGMNPNGYLDVRALEADQDWYVARGYVPTKVPMNQLVDHTFVERALLLIGTY